MPKRRRIVWAEILALGVLLAQPARSEAAPVMELYGTFESMGVIVSLAGGEDADEDGRADLSYRVAGSGDYRHGFPLSRVAAGRFVGSLFRLSPGTAYDVRVILSDPDGAPLDGAVVSGTASTRAEISVPSPGLSFHVSPTGTGTACTVASPCALTTALGQAQAGREVLLHGGTYHQGGLSLPNPGAAGAPIVIRSYPGETAVLDGADPATFAWTNQGGGVYRATVNVADSHLVMADGQRLYPYGTLADLQSLAWTVPGFFVDGTTVYVRLAGEGDPGAHAVLVSRFNTAFTVERDHIVFADLIFRHYGLGSYAKALYFDNASDNLVRGCTFAVNDLGIGFKRDSHRNVVQDNVFYDTDSTWPWEAVKAESGLETGGIRMYGPMNGRGTVIRHNTFHDYFDGFGVCPDESAAVTNETDVYANLVYNAGDDGMETDGQCSNVRIWKNTFHDVLAGISLAPVYTGPVYAFRNLIYRTGVGDNPYTGLSFKFNSGYDQSGPIYLFHNTADAVLPGGSGLAIMSPGSWKLIHARNNIWSGTEYAVNNANPGQPIDFDRDDLYTTQAEELVWWDGLADSHLRTLDEVRAATGQEQHGLAVAPGFVDAASGAYALGPGSQLIDQGMVIPGINDDHEGAAPDIGAYESSLSAAVHGLCGNASGDAFTSTPIADLCAAGTPTTVAGAGPWSWSCLGANGGADAQCSASLPGADGAGGGTTPGGDDGTGGGTAGASRSGGCATGGGSLSLAALIAIALRRRRS